MVFCKHKNIFGIPKKGIHSIRFMNIAIMDLLFTFIFAFLISKKYNSNMWTVFIILILLSLFFHKLFCVDSTFVLFFDSLFVC